MAAAVADFRPKAIAEAKLKKDAGVPELLLEPTPDILAELGERRTNQVLVGFAAETEDLEQAGRRKLESKHLDLLVGQPGGPFRHGLRRGYQRGDAAGRRRRAMSRSRTWTKRELAGAVIDRVAALLQDRAPGVGPAR